MTSYSWISYCFYDRSFIRSFTFFSHSRSSSPACAIYFLICYSMPKLPIELSVFSFAFVFLNSLSSESREECSLDRVSWDLLVPMLLIRSPRLLPRVPFHSRTGGFSFFYYIFNMR